MKKITTLILSLIISTAVFAASDVYEGFDYTIGTPVVGQNAGVGFTNSWTMSTAGSSEVKDGNTYTDSSGVALTVIGGSADIITSNTTGKITRNIANSYTSGVVYASILVDHVVETSSLDAGFEIGNIGCYWRGWGANWILGEGGNVWSTVPKPAEGETQLMVLKIDIDNNTLSVWKNPMVGVESTPDYTTATLASPVGTIDSVSIWQQGASGHAQQTVHFDEIRVGKTFADVLPAGVPVNVKASDGTYGDKVEITWNTVKGASDYEVWRADENDSSEASLLASSLTTNAYFDTTITPLVTYYYWVKSNLSEDFGGTDFGYATGPVPSTPNGVVASQTLTNEIMITWNIAARANKYQVFRNNYNDFDTASDISGEITTNEFTDTAVEKGASYFYWVKAGNDSGWSVESDEAYGYTEYTDSICYEDFDYTAGVDIVGTIGGLGFSAPWSGVGVGSMIAAEEGLTYPGLKVAGKSMRIMSTQEGGNTGSYLGERETMQIFGDAAVETIWYSYLFKADILQAGHFFLSVASGSGASGKAWGSLFSINNERTEVEIDPEQTYLLVTKYDANGTYLWINPALDAEPTIGSADISTGEILSEGNSVNLNLQPYYNTNSYFIDEMHVGKSFAEVTPNYIVRNVAASVGTYTDKVAVTWTLRSDATSYVVYRSTVNDSSTASAISGDLTTDSYDDTSATPGEVYFYWIYGTFNDGQQVFSYSDAGYRSAAGAPAPPANIDASDSVPDQKFVSITYDASAGATFYRIYRSFTEDFASAENVSDDIVQTSYADSSVIAGVKYYYWVRAKNASGWSNFGDSDSGAIPAILVAYYALNELDSTNMVDSSENGFDGIYRDDPVLGVASADAALFETAVDFFEVSDATINSNTPIRDLTNNFTVAMWVKPDEFGTDEYRYVMGLDSEAGGWTVQTYNDEVLLDITGKGNAWTGAALSLTEWTHVAFTFDYNNQVRAFVDGIALDAITKIGAPADYVMAETYIANGGDDDLYSGSLDEVRVYNGVVTDASIAELAGVPEPATLSMLLLSLIGLLVSRRK